LNDTCHIEKGPIPKKNRMTTGGGNLTHCSYQTNRLAMAIPWMWGRLTLTDTQRERRATRRVDRVVARLPRLPPRSVKRRASSEKKGGGVIHH